jgi:hypothetical protein
MHKERDTTGLFVLYAVPPEHRSRREEGKGQHVKPVEMRLCCAREWLGRTGTRTLRERLEKGDANGCEP